MWASGATTEGFDQPAHARQIDLDDESALRAADATGLLMHSAMGGAQLRGVGESVADGALAELAGIRARCLVWLTGRSARPRQAAAVVAALAEQAGSSTIPPITVVRSLPSWVGPLDVVMVSGDDPGDPVLASAVAEANRRSATVVIDLPPEGPVRSAADARTAWLPPLPHLPADRGLFHHLAAGLATLDAVSLSSRTLAAEADAVDAEIASSAPAIATPVNPAKLLALTVAASPAPRWVHADPLAEVASARAVAAFADAGRLTASVPIADELRAAAERHAITGITADPTERLFHDDDLDGTWTPTGDRRLGMVCVAEQDAIRASAQPLTDLEWVTELGVHAPEGAIDDRGRVLALMARIEMAAAYFLVGGQ